MSKVVPSNKILVGRQTLKKTLPTIIYSHTSERSSKEARINHQFVVGSGRSGSL